MGDNSSPNYPRNYNNSNNTQTFAIVAPEGEKVKILFEDFRLENSTNCQNDWLEIVETNSIAEEILLVKHCGDTIPTVKLSNKNAVVTVSFHADDSNTDKGFKYSWWTGVEGGKEPPPPSTTVKPEGSKRFCGGTITEMDCCKTALDGKCGYGEGDCDADEQCAGDLR